MGAFSVGPAANVSGQLKYTSPELHDELAGAFKVPGLRNLALTAPYMHDGRYTTLDDVVQHYRKLPDAALAAGEIQSIEITDQQTRQLVAFLKTLDGGYRILAE